MAYENIILERDKLDKRIAWLTLNRPERLNALSEALLEEVFDAVDQVDKDEETVALVIKGAGRSFSAGYDLAAPRASARDEGERPARGQVPRLGGSFRNLDATVERYLRLWRLRKPTIAQVHGYCLSGATELIAMCDIVIAAEDAQFTHIAGRDIGPLRTNGLYPFFMGVRKTKEYLFTGDFIDGKTAENWGLINKAVPFDELEEEAYDMARRVVRIPLEILSYHKAVTNLYYETIGLHDYLKHSIALCAMSTTECGEVTFQRIREKGLREANASRDLPWRQYQRVSLPNKQAEKVPW